MLRSRYFSGSATAGCLARHSPFRNGLKNVDPTPAAPEALAGERAGQPTTSRPSLLQGGMPGRVAVTLGVLAAIGGCSSEPAPAPTPVVAPAPPRTPAPSSLPARARVPGGSFLAGTEPGLFERRAALEPRLGRTALGPFEIDVEPYPGAGQPPLLGLSRDQAAASCVDRGGRLCTELEWERACRGPANDPFPGGNQLGPECATGRGCASGFGAYGMGRRPEWTASEVASASPRSVVTRGAPQVADVSDVSQRRCAHRELHSSAAEDGMAFRCCYGPPNAARVVLPRLGKAFERVELAPDVLGRWLATDPTTARLARELRMFPEPDGSRAVLARGGDSWPQPGVTTSPLRWNPAPGVELTVVAASSGPATSFVVVFDALPDGRQRVVASFVLEDEPGPVALGYDARARERVRFGTCWSCLGEMGHLAYREPDRVDIVQP